MWEKRVGKARKRVGPKHLGKCPQGGDSKTSEGTQGHGILYWVVLDIAKLPAPYVLLTNKKLSNYKTSLWAWKMWTSSPPHTIFFFFTNFGRNDAKAETPVLWPPHAKSWLIRKDSDAGRDWGQEEKGTTEDEMAGWHHWLDRREFEWTPGVGDGQGGLACCDSWGHKESDTTERLNWTELNLASQILVLPHKVGISNQIFYFKKINNIKHFLFIQFW